MVNVLADQLQCHTLNFLDDDIAQIRQNKEELILAVIGVLIIILYVVLSSKT